MKKLFILDNGGETFDRYTIVDTTTGDMIGASDNPFHPQGFWQFCGNIADNYWNVAYGYSWRNGCDKKLLNKRIKFAISDFKNNCDHIGKPIKWEQLPKDVQQFAKQSFN
jgi:hypothetical protein